MRNQWNSGAKNLPSRGGGIVERFKLVQPVQTISRSHYILASQRQPGDRSDLALKLEIQRQSRQQLQLLKTMKH